MRRAARLAALLLAIGPAGPAGAAGLDEWIASLARAERDFETACAALRDAPPPPGLVWLRLGPGGVEIAPASPEDAEAAAFWAEAALGARRAAEALYGQAEGAGLATRPVMIETGPDGVSLHDGAALARGDACDALRRMVPAMGDAPPSAQPFDAAREAAAERISAPRGGEARAALDEAVPDGAFARGPDGVTADVESDGEGRAFVALAVGADAVPGEAELRVYAPEDPFRPVSTLPLLILPGDAPEPEGVGAIAIGGSAEGAVPLGGEARLMIEVTEPGRVAFASRGETDLAATLVAEDGEPVASDDDSGPGYAFRLSAELRPGRYHLSLRHCCGGGGRFSVTASRE